MVPPVTLMMMCLVLPGVWGQNFRVGRGVADMTGLASEGALYGYGNPFQDARGLHLRQYSRAFIFESQIDQKRAALVVTETSMMSNALHLSVMERLEELYGDLYTAENVMLCPQHSHSAPGGYHAYFMYHIPNLGYINETTDAATDGIVRSIQMAHDNLQDGDVMVNSGELLDGNLNRSPYAYDQNPQEERDRYAHNVDKDMVILKLVDAFGSDLGMASFFAVHTTSMKNYNHLVSTDNKGYAAQMFERAVNPGILPGEVEIVGAFAQSAAGDASPNTNDARCEGTNVLCSYNTSTCEENWEDANPCTGRGPAGEQFADVQIIGERQYLKALELFDTADEFLSGVVDYRFAWVNMSDVVADIEGQPEELCPPTMGYSFGAGATDGPGGYPFYQGMLEGVPALDDLIDSLFGRPQWLIDCQAPKPLLLPTGILDEQPWPWQPSVVPLQLIRVGDVIIAGVPGEIATMAGRRLAESVKNVLVVGGLPDTTRVVVTAMANEYASYVVTTEEYQVQRYEAASTIFGQYTLDGYIKKFNELAESMANGESNDIGDAPPDLRSMPQPGLDPILTDALDPGEQYGDVLVDALDSYFTGETAFATFVSGNPRNNIKTDETFLEVQKQETDDSWSVVYTDVHWETKFIWISNCQERPPLCFLPNITGCTPFNISEFRCWDEQFSNATIEWDISANEEPGTYRLVHYGDARTPDGNVTSYTATSKAFEVVAARGHVYRLHSKEYYSATGEGTSEDENGSRLFDSLALYAYKLGDQIYGFTNK